jgi:hypothetical protein
MYPFTFQHRKLRKSAMFTYNYTISGQTKIVTDTLSYLDFREVTG